MSVHDVYERWIDHCTGVARRLAGAVRRYGWEPEDCEQQAGLRLWKLLNSDMIGRIENMPIEACKAYLAKAVQHAVLKAARGRGFPLPDVQETELAAVETRGEHWLASTIRECPINAVRDYLSEAVLGDRPTDDPLYTHGLGIRKRAALWLLAQLEGRKWHGRS